MSKEKEFQALRHSAAHILMQALTRLYPDAVPGVGPAIENGFYHDFDSKIKVTDADLPKIEKEMKKIVKENLSIKKIFKQRADAIKWFKQHKYKYTEELAKELPDKNISFYQQGEFMNMCKGPHIKSTGGIEHFKLTKIAGSYWRGSEKNKMIQRIYGTAFPMEKELKEYLFNLEESQKRDHSLLGQLLGLFMFDEDVGQGLPLWLPKGAILRKLVHDFALEEYLKRDYQLVSTPHIAHINLWKKSGHWDFYRDNMYAPFNIPKDLNCKNNPKEQYSLKPMNCPIHVKMYQADKHSYRDLPIRWTEMGTVYRYERSGVLHGLTRVRYFTQDDAHIICTPEQLKDEIDQVFKLTLYILKSFGFQDYEINLSTRELKAKKKYLGTDKQWQQAEKILEQILKENKVNYKIDPGEAVFYGPKIDVKIKDCIKRLWQLSTIQFDFNLPKRFNMVYTDRDGKDHQPYMIHRALLGSLERFIGILIEHYAGAFPLWLSPIQVYILSVGKSHKKFVEQLKEKLKAEKIRAEMNISNETVGYKIRLAEKQKIPYILVIGDKEMKSDKLAVRVRGRKDLINLTQDKFIQLIKDKVEKRDLSL